MTPPKSKKTITDHQDQFFTYGATNMIPAILQHRSNGWSNDKLKVNVDFSNQTTHTFNHMPE